jgi:hypothetical protein
MKYIITESQYKSLFTEQSAPVKIGCHDYNKIDILCSTLVFPKAEADKLIELYKPNANKDALERINSLSQRLISMGGEEGKNIAEKFSSSIYNSKTEIVKILTQYYPQSVYACYGLGPKINLSPIVSQICGVIYSNFIKSWNSNWIMKQLASAAITQDNIKQVQSKGKEVLGSVIDSISEMVNYYYLISTWTKVRNSVFQMEKTTPKCLKVIIIEDSNCSPILPYNPTQKYKNIGTSIIGENGKALARKTYSPKLVAFLNNLV